MRLRDGAPQEPARHVTPVGWLLLILVVGAVVAFAAGAQLVGAGFAFGAALIVIMAVTSWAWGGRPPNAAGWTPNQDWINQDPGSMVASEYEREHGYES